ncbi:MAG: transposase [Lachnospiraceae bacterium]|nr:transposase [Lachnospiraceae bacterium]
MSFSFNKYQQLSLWDSIGQLTTREQRFLERSWAFPFAEKVFPAIDESPYEVLYSDKDSRPNTPVNIIIGALILKEMNGLTDEALLNSLIFDIRYQVALHTTSYVEQPMSDRTLSRFRERCLNYQRQTGIDLLHNTIRDISNILADLMHMDRTLLRMDSLMIESNIRRLSRLELIYTCAALAVKEAAGSFEIPQDLLHYLDKSDYNDSFYHSNACEETVLKDALTALEYLTSADIQSKELLQLQRVLREQIIADEDKISLCDASQMHSQILQSPHDPDAAFRRKLKNNHVGYSANLLEVPGKEGSIILDYQYEKNIYSDSRFLKDTVRELGYQSKKTVLVADGGYSGKTNVDYALEKNIHLVTTNLTGKPNPKYLSFRQTEEFRAYARFRNGVEALPSLLRRKYKVDAMPVRGMLPTAFFFGCKIAAINVLKFCKYMQGSCLYAKAQG